MLRAPLFIASLLLILVLLNSSSALTAPQVINSPPATITRSNRISSNTTLNIFPGAEIGNFVRVGSQDGTSSNISVNVYGGLIGTHFRFYNGTTVNVSGGEFIAFSEAHDGSTVNITGGDVGHFFSAFSGSTVNLSEAGEIGSGFDANAGSVVNISGGIVGPNFDAKDDSTVNISGGSIFSMNAFNGSNVNFSGGTITGGVNALRGSNLNISGGSTRYFIRANLGSKVNISGGTRTDFFHARLGSEINLIGRQFELAGTDITPTLIPQVPLTVDQRQVTLKGILEDGSPFEFELNTTRVNDENYFHPGAKLTLTLVPEPAALTLLIIGSLMAYGSTPTGKYRD